LKANALVRKNLHQQAFAKLEENAKIQSLKSSNEIEEIVSTDKQIA